MNQETKNKLEYIILLQKNPLADSNNLARLKKELEYINVAGLSDQEMQLVNQALA